MTTVAEAKSTDTAGAKRMFDFITTFDGNLATGGFSPDQRRTIIGILVGTKVDALPEEVSAPATN